MPNKQNGQASFGLVNRLALTVGEPAGVGPDLTVQLAQTALTDQLVAICDKGLLERRAQILGLPLTLLDFDSNTRAPAPAGSLWVKHVP